MRILVMGAGAVGTYYGALLLQSGHDVTFVARGPQMAALLERGIELRLGEQRVLLGSVNAVSSPSDAAGDFDLILFGVKTYDTLAAAESLAPVIGPATAVLTLQNGIDSIDALSAVLGVEHVLAGTTVVIASLVEPGVVAATPGPVVMGELSGAMSPRIDAIATAFRDAGVATRVSRDAVRTVWEKFVLMAAHASITSASQLPVGEIRSIPEGVALYRALIAEAAAVGRRAGIALGPEVEEAAMATVLGAPDSAKSSMQRDYEAQHRVELEYLTGTVVRRGRDLGVPTPMFEALYAILKIRALAFGGLRGVESVMANGAA